MKIVYLTAGAAGMYCGSCLHDNAIAKAMMQLGHDTLLIPTYTPILTDETSVSADKLFYGGLNVYLQQMSPIFRWIPRWADSVLSTPRLVRWVASRSMGTTAEKLGPLTVSMLQGRDGNQRKEVQRLCDWLQHEQPDIVVFSNLLIAGGIQQIKATLGCPVVVVLQGDDIFYNSLLPKYRDAAITQLKILAENVDCFILNSHDYAVRMQAMLGFSGEKTLISPLSIDTADFEKRFEQRSEPAAQDQHAASIGYLARLAPEKGLHLLVDAFIELAKRERNTPLHLNIAGWLGSQHVDYWNEQQAKLDAAGLSERYRYWGSVDRLGKLEFLEAVDLLCVPTVSEEPKGLFALESLAAGVPVVLPKHGAFPEMIDRHGGGQLFAPGDTGDLVETLGRMIADPPYLRTLGKAGRQSVLRQGTTRVEAALWLDHFSQLIESD